MAIFAKRDNRFKHAHRQAAKLLCVQINDKPVVEAGAMYGLFRWKAEAYKTKNGSWLVVSSDEKSLSATVVPASSGITCASLAGQDAMLGLCADAGVESNLIEARREEAELQRMRAA